MSARLIWTRDGKVWTTTLRGVGLTVWEVASRPGQYQHALATGDHLFDTVEDAQIDCERVAGA